MTRKECLDAAAGCVLKDRQNEYGGPEDNFGRIAQMWNGYLGTNSIKPWDVAAMMGMLKMARARFNPKYADNWVDLAGYAACGIECATAQEEFDKALDEFQRQSLKNMFPKTEGREEPEFKPGDRVEFYEYNPNGNMWLPAEYIGRRNEVDRSWHAVKRLDSGEVALVHCGHLRKAEVKAEGCEDLVFDAPQTKEDLMERIAACNPATYGVHIE